MMLEVDPLFSIAEVMRRSGPNGRKFLAGQAPMQRAASGYLRHQKRSGGREAKIGAAIGRREAFVKIVRRGGTSTRGDLGEQLSYLSRQGQVTLEASDAYGGHAMS